MRENRADTVLAVVIAVLLHGVLLLLLVVGSWFRPASSLAAGEPISADVVDPNTLSARMRAALRADPVPLPEPAEPEPVEEPLPEAPLPDPLPEAVVEEQLKPQEQLVDPDTVDQQEVKADATSAETAQREQEAKRRQGQVDLTERERQQQAEQRAKNEMQRQREQQLEDIRRQRAQAQREAELAQAKLQQLADARARQASSAANSNASPPPGQGGAGPNLLAAYQQALQQAILANWTRPESVPLGQRCKIVIRQIPGGQVIEAQVDPSCPFDEPGRRSVERAVLLAQPLPYKGFESVFSRTVTLNFRAEDP
ncbi:TonB C-terminal domain-containing protein [Lysobacter brunescens]|uniref:TonB C-terminal domain-containing protein n=1 Tax=Lysobacter brunescens TaxID=262323 RepID=A0ABW2YFX4_9GAMM